MKKYILMIVFLNSVLPTAFAGEKEDPKNRFEKLVEKVRGMSPTTKKVLGVLTVFGILGGTAGGVFGGLYGRSHEPPVQNIQDSSSIDDSSLSSSEGITIESEIPLTLPCKPAVVDRREVFCRSHQPSYDWAVIKAQAYLLKERSAQSCVPGCYAASIRAIDNNPDFFDFAFPNGLGTEHKMSYVAISPDSYLVCPKGSWLNKAKEYLWRINGNPQYFEIPTEDDQLEGIFTLERYAPFFIPNPEAYEEVLEDSRLFDLIEVQKGSVDCIEEYE